MSDSYESPQAGRPESSPWLLFIHQIPAKPDYFRVKVRRRLRSLGAVALKGSIYVLPRTDDTLEDFQWLRRMVVDEGGTATLCVASFLEGMSDQEIEALFRARSDDEYADIIEAARGVDPEPGDADVRRIERQMAQASARDFFGAERAAEAQRVVTEVVASRAGRATGRGSSRGDDGATPHAATWVTRRGAHIDRIACAWLIRRFVDPLARFKYVRSEGYRPEPGEVRFDMFEGEYTHQGDRCTFEVLAARFVPDDASLRIIAEIVHDVDCKDEKFGRDEVAGVASMIRGITAAHDGDEERIAAGRGLFDGLYAAFQRGSV